MRKIKSKETALATEQKRAELIEKVKQLSGEECRLLLDSLSQQQKAGKLEKVG